MVHAPSQLLLLLSFLLAASGSAAQSLPLPTPWNTPLDLDLDGNPDTAVVDGDWDGDGVVETEDIQFAVNALRSESGLKQIWIRAGDYLPPESNEVGNHSGYAGRATGNGNNGGQVLIDSDHWVIECESGVRLVGVDFRSHTLTNTGTSPFEIFRARDVTVRGCHFDAGFPRGHGPARASGNLFMRHRLVDWEAWWEPNQWAGFSLVVRPGAEDEFRVPILSNSARSLQVESWPGNPPAPGDWYAIGFEDDQTNYGRMALEILESDEVLIEDCVVSDSAHAALYAKNTNDLTIRRSIIEYAGGFANLAPQGRNNFPFIYFFNGLSNPGWTTMHRILVEDVECRHGGGHCVNLRADHMTGDGLEGLVVRNLWAHDLENLRRERQAGINLSGVRGAQLVDNHIQDAQLGIVLQGDGANLGSYQDVQTNVDVEVRGNLIEDLAYDPYGSPQPVGIQVQSHNDGVVIADNAVRRVGVPAPGVTGASLGDCMRLSFPSRRVSATGNTLQRCGGAGLRQGGDVGAQPDETLLIDGVQIQTVDAYNRADQYPRNGIDLLGQVNGAIIQNFDISDFTGNGIHHEMGTLQGSQISQGLIQGLAKFRGAFLESHAASRICNGRTSNDWQVTLDASRGNECDFSSGTGANKSRCVCERKEWRVLDGGTQKGVGSFRATFSSNQFTDIECRDLVWGTCIDQPPGSQVNHYSTISAYSGRGVLDMLVGIDCNGGFCDVGDGSSIACGPEIPTCIRGNNQP